MGCSTDLHPTKEFILGHAERYEDWSPYTGVVPVDSDIVVILICLFIILAVLTCLIVVRRKYSESCFGVTNLIHKSGYMGIPSNSNNLSAQQHRNDNAIQMT